MPTQSRTSPITRYPGSGRPAIIAAGLVLAGALMATVLGGLAIFRDPGLPYNVRELVPAERPGVTLVVLGLCLLITGATPLLLAWSWDRRPGEFTWAGPLNGVSVAVLIYALLRVAVPLESIGDLVGAPVVLMIPAELENLGRFVGLYLGVLAGLTIGARLTIGRAPGRVDLPGLLALFASSGLSYTIVVVLACTDNVVELLRGGGNGISAIALLALTGVLGFAAGAVALAIIRAAEGRWWPSAGAAAVVLAAIPLGWLLLVLGTNPALTKYDRTFAARQFLLSPDRDHYLGDGALLLRFAVADASMIALLSVGMLIGRLLVPGGGPAACRLRPTRDRPLMSPPRRIHYAALAAAFTALAIYGSLVPLQFRAAPLDEAWERFRRIPYLELGIESRSDWVANILLFVPLGFLMTGALCVDRPGRLRAVASAAIVLPSCALLSVAIEFAQIWFPPRTVSQNDIAAEVLGGGAGIGLWFVAGRRVTAILRDYAATLVPRRNLDLILRAYLVGLLVYSVLPLDLTISPHDLWKKYRDGKVLLVGFEGRDPAESAYVIFAKIASFVPVGLLAASLLPPGRKRIDDLGRGLALGGSLAAAIEFVQLLVYSRVSSGADLLWGALGVGLGAGGPWNRRAHVADACGEPSSSVRRWFWLGLAAGYAAALAVVFWLPFGFTADQQVVRDRLSGLVGVPFSALYWGTDWNAITQVARKVLWFVPLGILIARGIVAGAIGPSRKPIGIGIGLLACLVVAVTIELGQVFQPAKFSDLTDILLYEAGAAVGLLLTWRLLDLQAVELRARSAPARR